MGVFALRPRPRPTAASGSGWPRRVLVFEELGRARVPGPASPTFLAAGLVDGAASGTAVVGVTPSGPPPSSSTSPSLDALVVRRRRGARCRRPAVLDGRRGDPPARPADAGHDRPRSWPSATACSTARRPGGARRRCSPRRCRSGWARPRSTRRGLRQGARSSSGGPSGPSRRSSTSSPTPRWRWRWPGPPCRRPRWRSTRRPRARERSSGAGRGLPRRRPGDPHVHPGPRRHGLHLGGRRPPLPQAVDRARPRLRWRGDRRRRARRDARLSAGYSGLNTNQHTQGERGRREEDRGGRRIGGHRPVVRDPSGQGRRRRRAGHATGGRLAAAVGEAGGGHPRPLDVCDAGSRKRFLDDLAATFETVDLVLCSVGTAELAAPVGCAGRGLGPHPCHQPHRTGPPDLRPPPAAGRRGCHRGALVRSGPGRPPRAGALCRQQGRARDDAEGLPDGAPRHGLSCVVVGATYPPSSAITSIATCSGRRWRTGSAMATSRSTSWPRMTWPPGALVEVFGAALRHPGVGIEEIVLRSPSGVLGAPIP